MSNKPLEGKRVLVTGGTGSLGKVLTRRLLTGEMGTLEKLIIFSRDEAKQHFMRVEFLHKYATTDDIIYRNFQRQLQFWIGDVRDERATTMAMRDVDVVINAAAMKQVPACEYFPYEAVKTNIQGAENIVQAIQSYHLPIETVVGVSTDKACKPINVMGMTKAVQERIFIHGNLRCPDTRFVAVRYGNVLASRGSVIPLFHDQIQRGGPVTITTPQMTRFLLSLEEAVDIVFESIRSAKPGETYIPKPDAAKVTDIAKALIGDRDIQKTIIGIRPGEKIHEDLIGLEEAYYTVDRGDYFAITPMLPELGGAHSDEPLLNEAYTSGSDLLPLDKVIELLKHRKLMLEDVSNEQGELLR